MTIISAKEKMGGIFFSGRRMHFNFGFWDKTSERTNMGIGDAHQDRVRSNVTRVVNRQGVINWGLQVATF